MSRKLNRTILSQKKIFLPTNFETTPKQQIYLDSIPQQNLGDPPSPCTLLYLARQRGGGDFQMLSYGSETFGMTYEGLGEMFEGDFVDTCAILLAQVMGG